MSSFESHAYPADLARAVLDAIRAHGAPIVESPLLAPALLDSVFSTIFQASLLRDEGRDVFFRALLCPPGALPEDGGPPEGLHALRFDDFRPFRVQELRRLAHAAPYQRALLGVCVDASGQPAIWGIVHSGARWLRVLTGGREVAPPLPDALVVTAGGAGRLEVSLGTRPLARLEGGLLGGTNLDVFASTWLPARFACIRSELLDEHAASRRTRAGVGDFAGEELVSRIGQHVLRQLIAVVRAARHGGTLLMVPREMATELCCANPLLHITYRAADGAARRRFRHVILDILRHVEASAPSPADAARRWSESTVGTDPAIDALDEGLFEAANLIAGLTGVDGAVVMTEGLELIGFGAEILGALPEVPQVARALDLEGTRVRVETTEGVGTRHRSAYRLCAANPRVLAIVISQDGGVRLACSRAGTVTYWHYLSAGLLS